LRFFKLIDVHVAPGLEIPVVLDNLPAHKAKPFIWHKTSEEIIAKVRRGASLAQVKSATHD